ncbi:MAG TPA: phosphate-starvation-inducible PsiE family protein [Gemmatimonadales bacterium]|nr:phosphate-starvation-inducible PsiE family protein [Gemmatimonadales bacterium]
MSTRRPRSWTELRREWPGLTAYKRFEGLVALALTVVISAVIVVALVRLVIDVAQTLVFRAHNPLDHAVFQRVFGEVMTLLIALEFNYTLQYVITHAPGVVHARIVILIALLAVARKIIVLDVQELPSGAVAALAGLALALAATYRLIGEPHEPARSPSGS